MIGKRMASTTEKMKKRMASKAESHAGLGEVVVVSEDDRTGMGTAVEEYRGAEVASQARLERTRLKKMGLQCGTPVDRLLSVVSRCRSICSSL